MTDTIITILYTTIRKYIRIALTNFSFIQETFQWSFKFFIMYKYVRIKGIKRVHHFLKCILVQYEYWYMPFITCKLRIIITHCIRHGTL